MTQTQPSGQEPEELLSEGPPRVILGRWIQVPSWKERNYRAAEVVIGVILDMAQADEYLTGKINPLPHPIPKGFYPLVVRDSESENLYPILATYKEASDAVGGDSPQVHGDRADDDAGPAADGREYGGDEEKGWSS